MSTLNFVLYWKVIKRDVHVRLYLTTVLIVFTDWLSLPSHFKLQEMNTKHREDLQQQLAKFHEVSLGAYQLLLTVRLTKSQMKS